MRSDKPSRLFLNIKDPFIKYINHGKSLQDKQNYRNLIEELTNLLEAAFQGEGFEYIYSDYDQS